MCTSTDHLHKDTSLSPIQHTALLLHIITIAYSIALTGQAKQGVVRKNRKKYMYLTYKVQECVNIYG